MNFQAYQDYFQSILQNSDPLAPYNQADYMNYTKLNWSRMKRWLKTGKLSEETIQSIQSIKVAQQWTIITEPWCGDAAHIVPFIEMMASLNELITTTYELRDSPPYRIDQYLSNGSKAIPKLVIKTNTGSELGNWGPRPKDCQSLFLQLKVDKADFETTKIALQEWYNHNQGKDIQAEITSILLAK